VNQSPFRGVLSRPRCAGALPRGVTLLTAFAALVATTAGCQQSGNAAAASASGAPPALTVAPEVPAAGSATPSVPFDANRAFDDLKKQVAFGPRVPERPGHEKCLAYILAELQKVGVTGKRQDFKWDLGGGRLLPMSNITAQFNPGVARQIMLCAHWDTRPTADQEVDPEKKKMPIPGADDGASGVAVLLELARQFAAKPPPVGVQIVFFDGEDYGPGEDRMYLGARYYAKHPALPKPDFAILIDMIGDADLDIYREQFSENAAPDVDDRIWNAAGALGDDGFKFGVKYTVDDDHKPLIDAGWKAVDLIDFDYGPWHTLDDTPDKCSPASLKQVGDVLAKVVYDDK
jgi:hypothetical protein